jgi:GT2 family glycosyltransferase
MPDLNIRMICPTRYSEADFYRETALGRSLKAGFDGLPFLEVVVFPNGNPGLPVVYNAAIRAAAAKPAVLLFVHDDVHLVDYYWPDRLYTGLAQFEIVGLIGNRRRLPRQPSWCFKDEWFAWDDFEQLSGFMSHSSALPCRVTRFGLVGAECKLLDGLFLAARSDVLLGQNLFFDEAFDFHFYDVDFCRQAEAKRLRMGTVPICVLHESAGKLRTDEWTDAYRRYLAKWGE